MAACSGGTNSATSGMGTNNTVDPSTGTPTPPPTGTQMMPAGTGVDPMTGQPVATPPVGTQMTTETPVSMTPAPTGPAVPPTATCDGQLPGSFTTICSGCHTKNGLANSRYPDLYKYMGTIDQFKTKVRTGGNGMAPYPATIVADQDLEAIYAFFTGNQRTGLDAVDLAGVTPLFSATDANTYPPITFTRDDGVLITRGAGRVRGRHEGPSDTNLPFMEFVENYFVDRTYGWIVEDYTPTGVSEIHATYMPVGPATGGTNFRVWKNYDNGDVFTTNGGLNGINAVPSLKAADGTDYGANYDTAIQKYALLQQGVTTTNTRDQAPIAAGQLFEFEFGIFFDAGTVQPPGSRHAYYTDTFRYQVGQGGVTSNNPDMYAGKGILGPLPQAQLGGATTNVWTYAMPETAFGQQALNIQHEHIQHWVQGRRLFHTNFETGDNVEMIEAMHPLAEQAGKAGPLNNTTACENCHINDGPGETLKGTMDETSSMAFKLYNAGALGNQLQLQEGSAKYLSSTTKDVTLGDGTVVTLSKPTFQVDGATNFSARIARKLIGIGLLEAIDERTLLARADMNDCDGDGISGRPNYITDPGTGVLRIGRMGWKAEKVGVAHQVADALEADLGVGTSLIPDSTGKAELSDDDYNDLITYMRLVNVPGQRTPTDPQVLQGETLFKTIGCSNCHVTDVVTGPNHPFRELQNQAIKPFTDLLLHDMGSDLADDSGIPVGTTEQSPAGASEWRTPPLWGTGMLATINGHTGLLHDGRAASVLEAALWHGGEAQGARDRLAALSSADRDAVVAFVMSL
ncbi:MAG TPA: di-heme oxidoredictase family protein [Polyangiaceae bacterium]|nr:di-heme oxidoredictase family protein [Polyangiaceae bacterium]